MDTNDLRRWGRAAVDWGANYLESLRDRPVRAPVAPGDVSARLAPRAPPQAEPLAAIMEDFERIIVPGMTHWQHPRFFAYFPANSSPPSVVAEILTATLAAQCMLWQTSPAATELETRMLEWLRDMLGLPADFTGVIQDSASSATFAAILTGRERALGWQGNRDGLAAHAPIRVYCSDQVHSSIDKAVFMSGIGLANLVKIPADSHDRLDTARLEQAIGADRAAGCHPAVVIASVGATSVGASDDLRAVGEVARRHGLYFHVDAAWAGSAMICPELRPLMDGVELADSFVFNPHKWLFTNFDCSAHFVRDPEALVRTLAVRPAYLRTAGREGIRDYSEWSPQLGRRFRALKLWFVIRAFGVSGLQEKIRQHCTWADEIAQWIAADPDFELVTGPNLSLLSFRYAPKGLDDDALDALNARLLEQINDDGRIYLTQTSYRGRYVIRLQVGQTWTTREDVVLAWDVIRESAARLAA